MTSIVQGVAVLSLLIAAPALADEALGSPFQMIEVPGATCGNGDPYAVYVKPGASGKVLLHFQGGGACWNAATCFGPAALTKLSLRKLPKKLLDERLPGNPFLDHTYVFVPYCTGDFFVGNHVTKYRGRSVRHVGRANVGLALDHLESREPGLLSEARDVVVYGESAGALGVLVNLDQIDARMIEARRRVAIPDSPGLHFNDNLWNRFQPAFLSDIDHGLAKNFMKRDPSSGLLAPELKRFCVGHKTWKVGIVQSTQDIVMSAIFGQLTPLQHRQRVLGKSGLAQQLKDPNDNCSSWSPESGRHVFSPDPRGWRARTRDGMTNGEFVRFLYEGELSDPYPSHL